MESSKVVCINLEELLIGIFSILLASDKELEITYDQLYEYESQVINYFQDRNYEIIVDNSIEQQNRIREVYPELIFNEEKITLFEGENFLEQMKNIFITENKSEALICEETINLLMPKQITKKMNSIC